MRSAIFRQYDSRWGSLKYPSGNYTMKSSGCGCCACTHLIIEKEKYKNYTPKDVRPYMVGQGFATKGNGTTWTGMTKTLEHYGFKVARPNISTSMSSAWKELNKGNRAGILLLKKGTRGSVTWTSGGHYVAFLKYKVQDGKHYFYTKDSGARKNDGWHCYETTMKGLLPQIWVVELPKEEPKAETKEEVKYSGTFPKLPSRGYFKLGDTGSQVKYLQKFLNWYGKYDLSVDGEAGPKTISAVKKFQKAMDLATDGKFGAKSLAKAKAVKK